MIASAMALPLNPYQEKLPPKPFAYQYGVKDEYSGTTFDKAETQDNYGNVQGEYKVQLPDGRIQIVSYTADHENGFVANVKYGKLAFCSCKVIIKRSA
jgi:hypothetical protein